MQPYCKFLEDWWVEQCTQYYQTPSTELALEAIREPVARLSDLFTLDRPKHFVDYTEDPATLLAYGIFFFPQSFMRARFPMRELLEFRNWKPAGKIVRVLDLGAGLGGIGLGLAWELAQKGYTIELVAVDHSPKSLAALQRMHAELKEQWPWLSVTTVVESIKQFTSKGWQQAPFDIISLGFAINEVWCVNSIDDKITWLDALKQHLKPEGLIIALEPALRETSKALYDVTRGMIDQRSWYSWGPLLSAHTDTRGEEDHEVRVWDTPESIAYINRKLFRDLRFLKYALSVLGRSLPNALPEPCHYTRMDTGFTERKGRLVAFGYAQDGLRYEYEMLTRSFKRPQIESIV
ncbi:MAG TPA: class I SAM-dependent methyltransferase, partial [Opitutales bacterium]|nr:class I SAM-dependent methyltransferase [Opitutales bacterium]